MVYSAPHMANWVHWIVFLRFAWTYHSTQIKLANYKWDHVPGNPAQEDRKHWKGMDL